MNDAIGMQLSAFVDGELPENEAEMLLRRLSQDVELRAEVAEYLALSRIVRGEIGIAGADRLHARVAAEIGEIGDRPAVEMGARSSTAVARSVKPLAGIAVAASVALLAIFGLRQINTDDEVLPVSETPFVPELASEQQRQYLLNHADASSRFGANGMNTRLESVSLQFSEEITDEAELEDKSEESETEEEQEEVPQPL